MVRRKDDICRKKERYPDEITSPSLFYIKGGDLFLFTHLTVDVSVFIYLSTDPHNDSHCYMPPQLTPRGIAFQLTRALRRA